MKFRSIAFAAVVLLCGCHQFASAPHEAVRVSAVDHSDGALTEIQLEGARDIQSVLMAQQTAWNRGDIDAFMEGYWKHEALRFASGGNVTNGWQATIDRYKARYKDRAAMGMLAFSGLDIQVLSDNAAVVHGQWALVRAADRPSGLFTLVFRNFGSGWVIVSDTTTSAD